MKNLAHLILLFLVSTNAMAQMSSDYLHSESSSQGLRLSLLKSATTVGIDAKYQGFSLFGDYKYDTSFGLSAGYANLPVEELGYTANLAFLQFKGDTETASAVRVDANLGYAFTSNFNLKGGANLTKFNKSEVLEKLNTSIGFQASLGFQINPRFGVDVGYTQMQLSGSLPIYNTWSGAQIGNADANATISGLEIAAHGTF